MNNEYLLKNLRNVPDFPVPGIQFKDVSTLYKNPKCLKLMVNELYDLCAGNRASSLPKRARKAT